MDEPEPRPAASSALRGHQPEDTPVRGVAVVLAAIVLSLLLIYLVVGVIGRAFGRHPRAEPVGETDLAVPRAAAHPSSLDTLAVERGRLEREQRIHLESFGWMDRSAGIAAIPVDDAMVLVAARGLPRFGAENRISPSGPKGGRR